MAVNTIKEYFERFNRYFYAMIGLPMLLFGWVYLPIKDQLSWQGSMAQPGLVAFIYLGGVILLASAFLGIRRSRRRLKLIHEAQPLVGKLSQYQREWMVFYMGVMVSSSLAVLLLSLTGNQLFVAVYALLLFLVSLYRPTINRLVRDLPLTEEELRTIKNQGDIV